MKNYVIAFLIGVSLYAVYFFTQEEFETPEPIISTIQEVEHSLGVVPPSFVADKKTWNLTFTDDNTGECLLIFTDNKDYFGAFGGFSAYVGVVNNCGVGQNVTFNFSFADKLSYSSLRVYEGEQTIVIKAWDDVTSTTTISHPESSWTESIWTTIGKSPSKVSRTSYTLKSTAGAGKKTETDSVFIASGETKYFMATARQNRIEEPEEWFIEALGDQGGYGHLDPNGWTGQDLFDEYADGTTAMDGLNGGTGWGVAWSETEGEIWEIASDFFVSAPVSAKSVGDGTNEEHLERTITTGTAAGTIYFSVRRDTSSGDEFNPTIAANLASGNCIIRFDTDGNIKIFDDGTGYVTIQAYNADQFYRIGVDWDDAAQNDMCRANVDDGTFTGYKNTNGGFTTLGAIILKGNESSSTNWVDSIAPDFTPVVAAGEEPHWFPGFTLDWFIDKAWAWKQ